MDLKFLYFYKKNLFALLRLFKFSKSQYNQDLFALTYLEIYKNWGQHPRFFVEFGATDGVSLSNTVLLEKQYGYQGILVEPAKIWQSELRKNRNCNLDFNCVYSESGKVLTFIEADYAELSTIKNFGTADGHQNERQSAKEYEVNTISLIDLLDYYHAPKVISFLSIDTEGSEYEILKNFDFDKYKFLTIAVEHAYTESKNLVFELLSSHGYVRVAEKLSACDDWFIYPNELPLNLADIRN